MCRTLRLESLSSAGLRMQPYPRSPDLVWPGHLHGLGCLSAQAVGTGFPTVGLRLWLGPGCGWVWVLLTPASRGWGLGWVFLGSVCGVVPLLLAVCGVRGWALVSACFWVVCGFVLVSLAPRRFRFRRAVWACVLGPGLGCAPPFLAGLSGCVLCAFFFFSRSLAVPVPGLFVSPPIPFLSGWAAGFFFFVSACFGAPFPGGPLFLAWCCRFWLGGPPVPLWGSCLRCPVGGGFRRLLCSWRAVWWLWAVFARPPLLRPFFLFLFGGGGLAVPPFAFPRLALALWLVCGVVGPSPLLAEVPVCYSPPLLAGFRCRWWWAVPATPGWGPLAAVVCGVWCVAVVGWWGCGWCVVWLVPRHSWRRSLCATPRHSWLGFAAGGGGRSPPLLAGVRWRRWCVVCGVWCVAVVCWWGCGWCVVWLVPRHSWRRLLCATPRHSWLGFAAGGGGRSPPLLAGVRWRRWCVVCGVWRWCVGGVVVGVWCGWSLATPGGGPCVLLPATPGWVSLPVVVGGPRHPWLGPAGGSGVWCVVCGGGVLVGLWLVCGVVGPSPLLAEVPVCYFPPLLAGFRCRRWWAVPATPGWGPLAAVVCGVWCVVCGVRCVAVVCWWGCGWCVVWLVPRHSWRRFLCATPRHSWLGFAAGGGGRSPPLLARVRWRPWCVVCGVWCVAVVGWWGCGWCVVWLAPRHSWRRSLCATPRHSWLGFPAGGGGRSPPLLAGVCWRPWCVVCGVLVGSLATPGGGSCVLLPATPGRVSLPVVVGGPRHSWLGSVGGGGVWCVAVVCWWGCGWARTRPSGRPLCACVFVCVLCLAGSGGPASRARSGAPHLFLWLLCLSALLRPLRAGVAPLSLAAVALPRCPGAVFWLFFSASRCLALRALAPCLCLPLGRWLLFGGCSPAPLPFCVSRFSSLLLAALAFFFLLLLPLCAPVVSGFLWFPAPGALGLGACVVCFGLPLFGSPCACPSFVLSTWLLAAPWWLLPPPPPPPPLCLAVFVAAARCCVPCGAVRPWVQCCATLLRVVSPVVVLSCALLRSFGAAACCAVPSGAARRPGALCSAALCFAVFPRCVCSVLCVFCCGAVVRAVVRRSALCCVCPGVLCCAFPVLSAPCGAVLRCAGALALCCSCGACCCWRLVLWCAAVCCAVSCGVPWCGAGSGGLWLSAGGVFRCRCPCLAAWSASLWLVWFAVVPCFPVSCSVVLCCRVVLCCCAPLSCCGAVGACFALSWAVVLCCVVLLVGRAVFCPVVVSACCDALFLVLCVPCLLRSVRCGALLCWLWCPASLCRVLWRCAVVRCCAVVLCCRFAVLFVFALPSCGLSCGASVVCAVVGASCCGVSLCVVVSPWTFCGVVVLLWCVVVSCCAVRCPVVSCALCRVLRCRAALRCCAGWLCCAVFCAAGVCFSFCPLFLC